ncbi:hypothetical protein QBC40DRAFT_293982 [Triangularia verruculosa]|uniref:Uncharacterized protein n=1 Tax=Triangularia verruculosa TaxID=2587418 RepID=A0AAN7AYM3_9PEZI|nr:hypothetical protein QBC40DRAFT_293982 [Triangularia verruculosa]
MANSNSKKEDGAQVVDDSNARIRHEELMRDICSMSREHLEQIVAVMLFDQPTRVQELLHDNDCTEYIYGEFTTEWLLLKNALLTTDDKSLRSARSMMVDQITDSFSKILQQTSISSSFETKANAAKVMLRVITLIVRLRRRLKRNIFQNFAGMERTCTGLVSVLARFSSRELSWLFKADDYWFGAQMLLLSEQVHEEDCHCCPEGLRRVLDAIENLIANSVHRVPRPSTVSGTLTPR